MNTRRLTCCDMTGNDCYQGKRCKADTLNTADGGESVDMPVFTPDDAFDWTQTVLVAIFCGVCVAAVLAPFIFA